MKGTKRRVGHEHATEFGSHGCTGSFRVALISKAARATGRFHMFAEKDFMSRVNNLSSGACCFRVSVGDSDSGTEDTNFE